MGKNSHRSSQIVIYYDFQGSLGSTNCMDILVQNHSTPLYSSFVPLLCLLSRQQCLASSGYVSVFRSSLLRIGWLRIVLGVHLWLATNAVDLSCFVIVRSAAMSWLHNTEYFQITTPTSVFHINSMTIPYCRNLSRIPALSDL